MRTPQRIRFISLVMTPLLVVALMLPTSAMAAEPTVNLGTAETFAILAYSGITNTGTSVITGDVGSAPTPSMTGFGSVTLDGAVHANDAVAILAKTDLVTAYDDAVGRAVTSALASPELGGLTLGPGVYTSGGALSLTGTLTLDAQGDPDAVFILKSDSTLITAADSVVELINGARFCRVFFPVASSATLGPNSTFAGHIFAVANIQAETGAEVEGQLMSMNGAVTLDGVVVTNALCPTARWINIEKTASPTALTTGPGTVTYTYTVTNPGTESLMNVTVTDNKLSTVTYVSGDDGNELLDPGETWLYTATTTLSVTTTNIATVTGYYNGLPTTDTATARVAVTRRTTTGGEIPDTATPWYNLLLAGAVLTFLGALGFTTRKSHD